MAACPAAPAGPILQPFVVEQTKQRVGVILAKWTISSEAPFFANTIFIAYDYMIAIYIYIYVCVSECNTLYQPLYACMFVFLLERHTLLIPTFRG